jgi:hypothetical protein
VTSSLLNNQKVRPYLQKEPKNETPLQKNQKVRPPLSKKNQKVRPSLQKEPKSETLSPKRVKRARDMAQVVELSSKWEALSLRPSTARRKKHTDIILN